MQRAMVTVVWLTLLGGGAARAQFEDGVMCFGAAGCVDPCDDGIDNDDDGLIDCAEDACKTSSPACTTAVAGPIAVGLADERPLFTFDRPMATATGDLTSRNLFTIVSNSVLVPRSSTLALYKNEPVDGYVSLPSVPTTMSGFSTAVPGAAIGSLGADTIPDLMLVTGGQTKRYTGTAAGGFNLFSTRAGSGVPASAGRTFAVAGSQLRLFDTRCTLAGTYAAGDSFTDGLCSSITLPATTGLTHIVGATVGGRNYFLTKRGTTLTLHEAVVTTTTFGTKVDAVLRYTTTLAGALQDLAYSPQDNLFIFSMAGQLEVRRLLAIPTSASLATVAAMPPFVPPAQPNGEPAVIGAITVGPLSANERSVVITEPKTERVHVVPFNTGGWLHHHVQTLSIDTSPADQRAIDVTIGQFDDDGRLDIAVLDNKSGGLIILRQQPDPCLAFIVSSSHGMLANGAPYPFIARFNHRLREQELVVANAARRPTTSFRNQQSTANRSLCPAELLDVRGNWEQMSSEGTPWIIVGRAGFTVASLVVWAPLPPLGVPMPAPTPLHFYASGLWALAGDPAALTRAAFAGFATVGEVLGRNQAAAASRRAARRLNAVTREAIEDVAPRLPTLAEDCHAPIFVDYIGHSRGGPVIQEAIRSGFGDRSAYNFEVSTTLIDAPDMSPWNWPSPWMRAGYIVGDPLLQRVGSEWNSNFYTHNSAGELDQLLVDHLPGNLRPEAFIEDWAAFQDEWLPWFLTSVVDDQAEFVRSEIIGLPHGRDRQAELEASARSFGGYQGPIKPVHHKELLGNPSDDPDDDVNVGYGMTWVARNGTTNIDAPHPLLENASEFAFRNVTHFGHFLSNPRGFDPEIAVGFHRSPDADANDELGYLPASCGGTGGGTTAVTAGDGRNAARRDSSGLIVRELVADFDFRMLAGAVEDAREIVDGYPGDPDLKALIPDDYGVMRDFILETVEQSWLVGGQWQRTGGVSLLAAHPSVGASLSPFIDAPGIDFNAWGAELEALTDDALFDRGETLDAAAAHLTSAADAGVRLASGGGGISTTLNPASLSSDKLLVRVEFRITSANGFVEVALRGPNLAASASWAATSVGTTRQVAELVVDRSAWSLTGEDTITVSGKAVDIYAVSVRSGLPFSVASGDSLYEFVTLDHGIAPERARHLASRSFYDGRQGRLARFKDTAALGSLVGHADSFGWVDGDSVDGSAGSFYDGDGNPIAAALFGTATFTAPRPRGAQAFANLDLPTRLDQLAPTTSYKRQRMGFWVEYPSPSSSARMGAGMKRMARAVAEFFGASTAADDSDSNDDVEVAAAGAPDCLSVDSLDCQR